MFGASVIPKLLGMPVASETLAQLGWSPARVMPIGLMELGLVVLYLYPRTSLLGAVLMTGLLGGVMATQIRVDSPLFSHQLFGLYLGLTMWGGLWLRDPSLREQFPFRPVARTSQAAD